MKYSVVLSRLQNLINCTPSQAEYEQALKEGKIEPQSVVTIIPENDNEYKGSWLEMNLDTGEMEEYME